MQLAEKETIAKLTDLFLRRFFSPTLKGGTGGEIMQLAEKETENPPPLRVGEMRIFSFIGPGKVMAGH